MFDPQSPTYVGVGSQFAGTFAPSGGVSKAGLEGKAATGFLSSDKAAAKYDTERRLEAQKSGAILLERGKEDDQIKSVPKGGRFYAYDPNAGQWMAFTKK